MLGLGRRTVFAIFDLVCQNAFVHVRFFCRSVFGLTRDLGHQKCVQLALWLGPIEMHLASIVAWVYRSVQLTLWLGFVAVCLVSFNWGWPKCTRPTLVVPLCFGTRPIDLMKHSYVGEWFFVALLNDSKSPLQSFRTTSWRGLVRILCMETQKREKKISSELCWKLFSLDKLVEVSQILPWQHFFLFGWRWSLEWTHSCKLLESPLGVTGGSNCPHFLLMKREG